MLSKQVVSLGLWRFGIFSFSLFWLLMEVLVQFWFSFDFLFQSVFNTFSIRVESSPLAFVSDATISGHIWWSHSSNKDWLTLQGYLLRKIAMWEEDNELFIVRNENIRLAQKPKYQKAVSVYWNETNIPSVTRTRTVTPLLATVKITIDNDIFGCSPGIEPLKYYCEHTCQLWG